ncbi:MAG: c-type cytochrome [Polyangiaceae bacterium]|nr:c-type cytochrome [Polyangiaceae bacterium]
MRALIILAVLLTAGTAYAEPTAGETSFQQKCVACHTVGGGRRVGPDLKGVTERRDPAWLERWIREPDRMLAEKDPVATQLLKESNQVPMPNLAVTEAEAKDLIAYMKAKSDAAAAGPATPAAPPPSPHLGEVQTVAVVLFVLLSLVVAGVFAAVARSTRLAVPTIDTKRAYAVRRVFFFVAGTVMLVLLLATLRRTPYAAARAPDRVVYVVAKQFAFFYSAEPITSDAELARAPKLDPLTFAAGSVVEFRVTSLDVNHAFGLYGPDGAVFAQTQAMPGYVNRLRVSLPKAGEYHVLCFEYCGTGHHLMQSSFTVR